MDLHNFITGALEEEKAFTVDLIHQWKVRKSPDDDKDKTSVSPPKRKRVEEPKNSKVRKTSKDAPAKISSQKSKANTVHKKSVDASALLAAQDIVAFATKYDDVFPVTHSHQQQNHKKEQQPQTSRPLPRKQSDENVHPQRNVGQVQQKSPPLPSPYWNGKRQGLPPASTGMNNQRFQAQREAEQFAPQPKSLQQKQSKTHILVPQQQNSAKKRQQPKTSKSLPEKQPVPESALPPSPSPRSEADSDPDDWLYEGELEDLASTGRVIRSVMATLDGFSESAEGNILHSSLQEDSAFLSDDSDDGSKESKELDSLRKRILKLEQENKQLKRKLDACQCAGKSYAVWRVTRLVQS